MTVRHGEDGVVGYVYVERDGSECRLLGTLYAGMPGAIYSRCSSKVSRCCKDHHKINNEATDIS